MGASMLTRVTGCAALLRAERLADGAPRRYLPPAGQHQGKGVREVVEGLRKEGMCYRWGVDVIFKWDADGYIRLSNGIGPERCPEYEVI